MGVEVRGTNFCGISSAIYSRVGYIVDMLIFFIHSHAINNLHSVFFVERDRSKEIVSNVSELMQL